MLKDKTIFAFLLISLAALGEGTAVAAADPFANPIPHPGADTHIVIQITGNSPKTENIVLHNVANILKFYGPKQVETEVVAYGPGIDL